MGSDSKLRQHHSTPSSNMHAKSTNTADVIMELLKGKETAIRLQNLLGLREPPPPSDHHHNVSAAEDLALQILTSFTHTLSLLATSRRAASTRDRRGCYKRRRSSYSPVTISPVMGDSYSWRKYGQKIILNSEYPRCYFRCTNKYDRGCKATKQVQIIQENPIMYQTTYFDLHTCTSTTDDDEDDAPITTSAPPPTAVSGSDLCDHGQPDPTNTTTELDIIHNSVSETDTSQLQYQWLDFTGPEYQPDQAPLQTGSYREEGFHSIDMDVIGFGDIDNFHLDQIF